VKAGAWGEWAGSYAKLADFIEKYRSVETSKDPWKQMLDQIKTA